MSKKHVKVIVRTRPTSSFAQDLIQIKDKNIHIHIPKNEEWGYINNQQQDWDFTFDKVLHNVSQNQVYEDCVPVVRGVLEGYNGTILAYGQTGAGKTFTMTGASENYKHRGLIPRAISHLFREIADKDQLAFTIRISYLEIYNEHMVDLLSSLGDGQTTDALTVVEEKSGATYVKGLTVKIANTEEEALHLLFEGETNRSIAEHQMNRNSSRSHTIFTIHVESRSRVESCEKVMTSKMNFVDLAGSERLSKTETKGVTLKEAMYINRSLTYLEQVIIALADKRRDHIPFRQSKMTHVLRDALGGNCNTLMIANIWCQKEHLEETISTLRFSTRMMCVQVTPEVNVHYDPIALIKKYEKEIKELKQELSMHDTLANRSHIQYEPYTEAQRIELTKVVRNYIDTEEDIEVVNIRQMKEILHIFRMLYRNLQEEERKKDSSESKEATRKLVQQTEAERVDDGVGDVEGSGFGVGIAPSLKGKTTLPVQKSVLKKKVVEEEEHVEKDAPEDFILDQTTGVLNRKGPMSRAEEFEVFKRGRGSEMSRILAENKQTLKNKKKQAKELAESVNEIKRQIDELKAQLGHTQLHHANQGDQIIIDQKEYQNISQLKNLKEEYKKHYESLKPLRVDIEYCTKLTDQCRQKLMTEFETWYETIHGSQEQNQDDLLDIGEKFDRLQMERMALEDPDSLPFYNAKKSSLKALKKAPIIRPGLAPNRAK